ncbi:MAG: hypothetical protein LUE14_11600 [Clostridiales bacterium]|nr:hypothetical protein [Clostridiales bacterium]
MKQRKRIFKSGVAAASAVALTVGMLPVSALAVSYDAPSAGMEADNDTYLTGATAAANTVVLSLLGINVTSSDGAGLYQASGSTDSYGTDSSNLGIFGSDINDNPDPYIYNFFYNLNSTESGGGTYSADDYSAWTATPYSLIWGSNKSGPTGQASGTTTITVGGVTKTTNPAFFYEPDILLGGSSNGYATELANYQADYNADYDPTVFLGYGTGSGNYAASGTRSDGLGLEYNQFDMTKGVVYLGSVVQNLMNETGKVNRYDQGTYEIAVDYDKYDRGLYYYVLSEIADGTLTQVRYASSLSYDADTGYFVSQGTGRNAQYASGIGIDIYDLLAEGYTFSDGTVVEATTVESSGGQGGPGGGSSTSTGYYLTTDQLIEILNAPTAENEDATGIIIGSSLSSVDTEDSDLANAGIRSLSNLPSCVYGMTMQTVENGMGIPFYIGFFYYNQDESLNPVSYIYYWMENFYHVSDTDAMDLVINNMLADSDLPSALSLSGSHASSYSSTEIEEQIVAGIAYYQNTLEPAYDAMVEAGEIESDSALYWTSLDTSVGIGSSIRDTNTNFTCASGESFTDSFGNVIYSFTYTSTASSANLQTAYEYSQILVNALDESSYTEESWSALLAAQETAKTVLDNEYASQTEIDDALAALNEAAAALTLAEAEVYTGDTLAIRSGNTFYLYDALGDSTYSTSVDYGRVDDEVLVGDWDGDGVETFCVRRGNTYYFSNDTTFTSTTEDVKLDYGRTTDEVIVGDWDNDGCDTLCVRRGNTYYFSNDLTSTTAEVVLDYGKATDEILVGDWDGDGSVTICARRDGTTYYFSNDATFTSTTEDVKVSDLGYTSDEVLVGDWDSNGSDELALRRTTSIYLQSDIEDTTLATTIRMSQATSNNSVFVIDWK